MNNWSESEEKTYRKKLAAMEESLPPMPKFDPAIWRKREGIRQQFILSLSPAERLRHAIKGEAIIV